MFLLKEYFMVRGGEGKLVTAWKPFALGLVMLLNPVPWSRWSGLGKGTNCPKLLVSEGL